MTTVHYSYLNSWDLDLKTQVESRIAKLNPVSTEKVTAPLIRLMRWWLPRVLLGSCLHGRSLGIPIEYSFE